MNDLAEAALAYADFGFFVLPLTWPVGLGECSCGCDDRRCWRRAKHPLVRLDDSSNDVQTISEWWTRWPQANVGIDTKRSNLVVIDLDLRAGPGDFLGVFLERWGGDVLSTVVATTGTGYHLYYRRKETRERFYQGRDRLGSGVDVITEGYVVSPPSVHSTMQTYGWRRGSSPGERRPAHPPASLERALGERPSIGWYARNAPFAAAELLNLSLDSRARARGLAKKLRFRV